jgi:hypothetical protein
MSRRDKVASQIVFDITGGEKELATMNLSTIPNKPQLVRSEKESFALRTDDIAGARHVPRQIVERDWMDTSDIPGTCAKPMVNESKPPVDIMRVDDIEGSKPRVFRHLPHSTRMLNPVDPQYHLPSKPPEPVDVPRFIRDSMYNDDVDGAHPTSYKSDKPPRDIMRIDDIPGTRPVRQIRELSRRFDSLNVQDINTDGIFKTK